MKLKEEERVRKRGEEAEKWVNGKEDEREDIIRKCGLWDVEDVE